MPSDRWFQPILYHPVVVTIFKQIEPRVYPRSMAMFIILVHTVWMQITFLQAGPAWL